MNDNEEKINYASIPPEITINLSNTDIVFRGSFIDKKSPKMLK